MLALRRGPLVARIHSHSRSLSTASSSSPIRRGIYATAFVISTGLFAVYYFDARSALHRYILTPALRHTLDAELGHKIAVKVLKSGLGPRDPCSDDSRLKSEFLGKQISNPIGLAAGFDKDGEAIDGLFNLGFSWVEIGSVTPKPQPGNPKPRVFRLLEDSGLINRYGFPSDGHASVLARLRARIPAFQQTHDNAAFRPESVLAVNLGKNKDSSLDSIDDFITGVRNFGPYSDVLVVNVSSPNTPGLRGLQNRDLLEKLLDGVTKARDDLPVSDLTSTRPKLLLKLSPDLDEAQIIDIADVIKKSKIDGVIVSNTTIQRPKSLISINKTELGGLSGAPVKPYSLKALRTLRSYLPSSIPLIGCGGIFTGADALEYAKAGASLVQVYTGFGYDGVGTCRRIKDQLSEELEREGTTWSQVVKRAVDELSLKPEVKTSPPNDEKGEKSINQLIADAEHLRVLLDTLDKKLEVEAEQD
ncbi:hypothetical protein E4T56_gene12563 [Termitomyces sp. T112]|nr:hypothetical protein E4T56_gene12563 [Termitomyces sp. T112]KAH0582870.1 hypothetical protein H2248_010773 [Termitomyces sp. 'cryptogamus']